MPMILEVHLQIGDPLTVSTRPKVQFAIVGAGGCGTTSLRKNLEECPVDAKHACKTTNCVQVPFFFAGEC